MGVACATTDAAGIQRQSLVGCGPANESAPGVKSAPGFSFCPRGVSGKPLCREPSAISRGHYCPAASLHLRRV